MVTNADQLLAFVFRHKLALVLHQIHEVKACHVIWVPVSQRLLNGLMLAYT